MPSGARPLRKILFTREELTDPGVAVTGVNKKFLVGTIGMRPTQELYMPDQLETGRFSSYDRSQVIAREAALPFESDANYDQLPYLLGMAICREGEYNAALTVPQLQNGVVDDIAAVGATAATTTVRGGTGEFVVTMPTAVAVGADGNGYTIEVNLSATDEIAVLVGRVIRVARAAASITMTLLEAEITGITGFTAGTITDPTEVLDHDATFVFTGGIDAIGLGGIWEYHPRYGSRNNYNSFTVDYGDDIRAFRTSFVQCRQLEFSGQVGEVVRVSADLFGRGVESRSASLLVGDAAPTVLESVKMADGQFYLDYDWTTAVGATPSGLPGTLIDFGFRFTTGLSPVKFLDNRYDFSEVAQGRRHVELDLTIGFNEHAAGLFENYVAQDYVIPQMKFNGSRISTMNRNLSLAMGGFITEYSELSEREGQDIVKLKIVSAYDSTEDQDMAVSLNSGLTRALFDA